jgi:hypothetical protein
MSSTNLPQTNCSTNPIAKSSKILLWWLPKWLHDKSEGGRKTWLQNRSYRIFLIKILIKEEKNLRKLVLALILLKSPWWVAFVEGDFVNFWSKVGRRCWILRSFHDWKLNLKFKIMFSQLSSIVRVLFTIGTITHSYPHLHMPTLVAILSYDNFQIDNWCISLLKLEKFNDSLFNE